MDTLTEVRQLRSDLLTLGDYATAELLAKAERSFAAWHFARGYVLLEQALEQHQHFDVNERPARGLAHYFGASVAARA